jgi:hypothetical protein
MKGFFRTGQVIHLGMNNPGFDLACFMKTERDEPYGIFIETRFSSEDASTVEGRAAVLRKYNLIKREYESFIISNLKHWVFIYIAYRQETANIRDNLPDNVLVLGIDDVKKAYGPTYSTPALM